MLFTVQCVLACAAVAVAKSATPQFAAINYVDGALYFPPNNPALDPLYQLQWDKDIDPRAAKLLQGLDAPAVAEVFTANTQSLVAAGKGKVLAGDLLGDHLVLTTSSPALSLVGSAYNYLASIHPGEIETYVTAQVDAAVPSSVAGVHGYIYHKLVKPYFNMFIGGWRVRFLMKLLNFTAGSMQKVIFGVRAVTNVFRPSVKHSSQLTVFVDKNWAPAAKHAAHVVTIKSDNKKFAVADARAKVLLKLKTGKQPKCVVTADGEGGHLTIRWTDAGAKLLAPCKTVENFL